MELITYRKTLDVHKNGIQFTLQGFETADKLSRRLEISLMASGDAVDFPLEGVVALMYITTPSATEPSIDDNCSIRDNVVVYDVPAIAEEGITEMQIKLIGARVGGAEAVLATPRFAVEVTKSNTDDEPAMQSEAFTNLENAVAKANAVYNERLTKVEFDELCIFRAYYADGTVYETDAVQKHLLQVTTDMDMTALVRDGLANFTADEVAEVLDEKYATAFAKAVYTNSLANVYEEPTFVEWDDKTVNTPYKAGLTEASKGFAICYGDTLNHTAIAWTLGAEGASTYIRRIIGGTPKEWHTYLTEQGGTINGLLKIKPAPGSTYATLSLSDADGVRVGLLEKNPTTHQISLWSKGAKSEKGDNYTLLQLSPETSEIANLLMLQRSVDGAKKTYKVYGEHNLPYVAQIHSGSYQGAETEGGQDSVVIKSPFPIKMVILTGNGTMIAIPGRASAFSIGPGAGMTVGWSKVSWGDKTLTITSNVDKWNDSATTYSYVIFG